MNAVTKSGTNRFHGIGFYYVRSSGFAARAAELDIKPSDTQQQFGFRIGGPLSRNRAFFFVGYDQHVFHEPTVVRFVNGGEVVVRSLLLDLPRPEATTLQANRWCSPLQRNCHTKQDSIRQKVLGNAGFVKVDLTLSAYNLLLLRVNTSRYSGENNAFLDPANPMTPCGISDN